MKNDYNRNNDENRDIFNFVEESLQKAHYKKLNISNYYGTIKYFNNPNNTIDGIFYFGEPPHIFDPINYKKEDFIEINAEAGYQKLYWGLKFDNIDFINKTTGNIISLGKYYTAEYCLIYPELNFFITSENFIGRIRKDFLIHLFIRKKIKNIIPQYVMNYFFSC